MDFPWISHDLVHFPSRMAGDASGALRLSEAAAAMRAHGEKLRSYAKDAPEKGDFTVVGLDIIITREMIPFSCLKMIPLPNNYT